MNRTLPYAPVIARLLKGTVEYIDKGTWEKLLQYKHELITFLYQIGLILVLDEVDGYAFTKQIPSGEDDTAVSWIQRRALSYDESIMLVLLREMIAEFEMSEATHRELIKKRREIKEHAELFFRQNPSKVKFLKEIDRLIDKTEESGFLYKTEDNDLLDEQKFRVAKVIKARVNSEELDLFISQLNEVTN